MGSESKTVFRPRNALRILGTIAHKARRASCYVRRQHGKRALNFARKFQDRKNLVNKFRTKKSTQSMSESKTVFRPRNALRILGTIAHRARRASCYVRRQHGKRALNFA